MRHFVQKCFFAVALTAVLAGSGFASPLSSRLLPLVPPGAQIVAGFENHPGTKCQGRLLLTTHNNRLDLDDFQSLTGVDNRRFLEEVIEVAVSPSSGALTEHLLLVAGRFDREKIFRSVEQNGAQSTKFQGERIWLIKPFGRERGDMLETRWFAILESRIAILGTPAIVQQALRRYADHAVPDSALEERLSLMRSDLTSWNVLVESPRTVKAINFAQVYSAWSELQHDADVLLVGARFGSKIRVDFSIYANAEYGEEFFARKASFFTDALATGPEAEPATLHPGGPRVARYTVQSNHVEGSLELSGRQFEQWCEHLYRVHGQQSTVVARGN